MSNVRCIGRAVSSRDSHAPTLMGRILFRLCTRHTTTPTTTLSPIDTKMLDTFYVSFLDAIGYAVAILFIIGTFFSCHLAAWALMTSQSLFFATSTTAIQMRRVSTNYHLFSGFASTLDIVVTAPPGPSPTAGNRDAHYHYHYNDRRRIYYQNINSNNSQSTTYSNCFNDHTTKVYKGQRYVGDVNSDSVIGSNGFPFLIISS